MASGVNRKKRLARVGKKEQKLCGMSKKGSHTKNGKRPVTPAFVIRA